MCAPRRRRGSLATDGVSPALSMPARRPPPCGGSWAAWVAHQVFEGGATHTAPPSPELAPPCGCTISVSAIARGGIGPIGLGAGAGPRSLLGARTASFAVVLLRPRLIGAYTSTQCISARMEYVSVRPGKHPAFAFLGCTARPHEAPVCEGAGGVAAPSARWPTSGGKERAVRRVGRLGSSVCRSGRGPPFCRTP